MIYDYLSNKNHLNCSLFIGNKSLHGFNNLNLEYQGDKSCSIWIRDTPKN